MISSELLAGVASDNVTSAVLEQLEIDTPAGNIGYMVFRTQLNDKEYLTCWAGGAVSDESGLSLTPIGVGALEALSNLEADTQEGIDVYPIDAESEAELAERVEAILSNLPSRSRVCFVGDVAGKLRPWLPGAFNVANWQA